MTWGSTKAYCGFVFYCLSLDSCVLGLLMFVYFLIYFIIFFLWKTQEIIYCFGQCVTWILPLTEACLLEQINWKQDLQAWVSFLSKTMVCMYVMTDMWPELRYRAKKSRLVPGLRKEQVSANNQDGVSWGSQQWCEQRALTALSNPYKLTRCEEGEDVYGRIRGTLLRGGLWSWQPILVHFLPYWNGDSRAAKSSSLNCNLLIFKTLSSSLSGPACLRILGIMRIMKK